MNTPEQTRDELMQKAERLNKLAGVFWDYIEASTLEELEGAILSLALEHMVLKNHIKSRQEWLDFNLQASVRAINHIVNKRHNNE